MIDDVPMIQEFKEEYYFEPKENWPISEYLNRIYSRWACDEIIDSLIRHPNEPTIDILWRLHNKFVKYSNRLISLDICYRNFNDPLYICVTAADTIQDIGLLFV